MANTEVQELIAAVAKKHKLVLAVDDPVLVTVSLNELLLSRYVEKITAAVEAVEARTAVGSVQQLEAAKMVARQIVTGAGDYIAERVKGAVLEAQAGLTESGQRQIAEMKQTVHAARRIARVIWCGVAVALASLSLIVGIAIGYWMQH